MSNPAPDRNDGLWLMIGFVVGNLAILGALTWHRIF